MARPLARAWVLGSTLTVAGALACERDTAPVELRSVADAPNHADAERLSFPGTARVDLLGETRWRNSSSSRGASVGSGPPNMAMFVVPVVAAGWTPDQPIPAWLTSSEPIVDPGPWLAEVARHEGPFVGQSVDVAGREPNLSRTTSGWQKAIADAEAKHGIRSDPNAPIVSWPPESS